MKNHIKLFIYLGQRAKHLAVNPVLFFIFGKVQKITAPVGGHKS